MSTKTTFKRIALVAVAAMGFGVLSVAPSANAAVLGETITLSSATAAVTQGDTATVTVTNTWTSTADYDSVVVKASCTAPTGGTCPASDNFSFSWTAAPDSTAATMLTAVGISGGAYTQNTVATTGFQESASTASGAVKGVVTLKFVASTSTGIGDYVITVYTTKYNAGTVAALDKSATWTVTVSKGNTTATSANVYIADASLSATNTAANAKFAFQSPTDSATVYSAGTVGTTYTPVAIAYLNVLNSAGDTKTAAAVNICASGCDVTVNLSGPGMLKLGQFTAAQSSSVAKSVTMNVKNGPITSQGTAETLTVMSDGTPGTGTLTFYSGSTLLATKTIVFGGATAGSITSVGLSDTTTVKGTSVTLSGTAKDSTGNFLPTGSLVYLYSSDSAVAGTYQNSAFTGYNAGCTAVTTSGRFSCTVTANDTGTATLYVKDSNTAAASTVSSTGLVLTVLGTEAKSYTVTFDKASYTPGEKAIITITGKDTAGRALGTNTDATNAVAIVASSSMTIQNTWPLVGTLNGVSLTSGTFTGYAPSGADSGVETRVVTMPTYGTTVSFALSYYPAFSATTAAKTTVTATATVADPTKDAADAATDAALEATDAAYAAQDAAQLAAEAADAATAAAEAATAAVEDLATQVASLFADLQKQITTLANVVAKIAKKVKA